MSLSRIIHHSHSFTELEIYHHIYFMKIFHWNLVFFARLSSLFSPGFNLWDESSSPGGNSETLIPLEVVLNSFLKGSVHKDRVEILHKIRP